MPVTGLNRNQPATANAGRGHHWGNFRSVSDLPGASVLERASGDLASVDDELYILDGTTWRALVPVASEGPSRLFNVPLDPSDANLTAAGLATVTFSAATILHYSEVYVDHRRVVTNVNVLQGTTVGTDKLRAVVYDESGAHVAQSAVAGVDTSGADTFLQIPLTAATTLAPGRYYVGVLCNGTTDEIQVVDAGYPYGICEAEGSHAFAEDGVDITSLASGFTDNVGPIYFLD